MTAFEAPLFSPKLNLTDICVMLPFLFKQPGIGVKRLLIVFLGMVFLGCTTSAMAEELRGQAYWDGLKHDVVETPSGLKYKALITGNGKKPKATSRVIVHYRGLLLNGAMVDTSFDKDEPVTVNLGKAIKGWKEGLQLMPVGSVFVFMIPPELAYGEKGTSVIPSNSTLIFEIELFGIK